MIEQGTIVRSLKGRDKHRYYVVLQSSFDSVVLADGKVRRLETPKQKNIKHIQATNKRLKLDEITSNKHLRGILEPMNKQLKKTATKGI